MTLKEFKEAVLQYIEEYEPESKLLTGDIDISTKINAVINGKMNEISRYKKIQDKDTIDVTKDQEIEIGDIDKRCYQIERIRGVKFVQNGKYIMFNEDGVATIYYYKYPKMIDEETIDEDYKFEIDQDALEIMKIGVAADLLKMDISNRFGQIWDSEYQRLLQTLDSRKNAGTIFIGEGVGI